MLAAVKKEIGERGYAAASVTSIAGRAKVTRPGFYHLFADKEAALLAAFGEAAAELIAEVKAALAGAAPKDAHRGMLGTLARLARERPEDFKLLADEALVAGPRALAGRDAMMAELTALVEARWSEAKGKETIPDLPALLVIGGVMRYFAMALRHGSVDWGQDVGELEAWLDCYAVSRQRRTWRDLSPVDGLSSPDAIGNRIQAPRHLPRRGEIPAVAYAAIEREHIVHATAALVSEHGFDATEVSEIAAVAGIPREGFYRHFDSKRAAVDAVATLLFEQAMAGMAGAYFTPGRPWTDRIWQSSWALTTVLGSAPTFTHVAFIDAFAPDPASARRADELFLGFTIFLTEGSEVSDSRAVPGLTPRAITAATIELGATAAVRGTVAALPGLVPLGTILTLAPYIGIEAANAFVSEQTKGGRRG